MQHEIWDNEALVFLQILCDIVGINNAILRDKAKECLKKTFKVYGKKKCSQMIFKYGVQAKNLKTVKECIVILYEFIIEEGINEISGKDLQVVAKIVDHSDKNVREAALSFMDEIYKKIGD